MKNRAIKLIFCICVISCLMVGFCSAFASAEPAWLIRAKAGIAAAMLASNLFINPVNYALDDAIAEGIDPVGYVLNIQNTPWELYLEQSVIKVVPDTVYIDGVSYSDIWLGPSAADSLRLAGLDFVSAYNILSNQSEAISYADGIGYICDLPAYLVNGQKRTQGTYFPWSYNERVDSTYGSINYWVYSDSQDGRMGWSNWSNGGVAPSGGYRCYNLNNESYIGLNTSNNRWYFYQYGYERPLDAVFTNSPFEFDYTSGVIDAPISEEEGTRSKRPSSSEIGASITPDV